MASPVIKVENLSKLYRLGEVSTGTISHDLNRWWHQVRGKEDPYAPVGQVNDRTKKAEKPKTEAKNAESPSDKASDYVYALKDINFEVKQGEVLGIIGRNGAGKSTLLKILSRVTAPSSGSIKVKGRIASLLEVGTGFHPELTGRENIYLNGAILGMRRHEIRSKFDEIIAFAEIEKFIDTPVKRYSSGMYVRLAFAVAAHLEPEILIVDEVLAVGDQQFQDKCIGKMQEVSRGGRTVLFVSHQMEMVDRLTTKCLWMEQGNVHKVGSTKIVAAEYMNSGKTTAGTLANYRVESIKEAPLIESVMTFNVEGQSQGVFRQGEEITISVIIYSPKYLSFDVAVVVENNREHSLFTTHLTDCRDAIATRGKTILTVSIKPPLLRRGRYKVSLAAFSPDKRDFFDVIHHYPLFEIAGTADESFPDDIRWGDIFLRLPWSIR